MALTATPQERADMRIGSVTLKNGAHTVKIHGMIGVLKDLGWTPDASGTDLASLAVQKTVNRPAHKRSRWLTDAIGTSVAASTATVRYYSSRRGTSLPGRPIRIRNVEENVEYTVHLDGVMGTFLMLLDDNRFPFDAEIYGATGNRYVAILHKTRPAPTSGAQAGGNP